MLEAGRELPVVTPVEPAEPDFIGPVGDDVRLPEVLVVERAELVRINYQIAVQVVPGHCGDVDRRDDRVEVLAHVHRVGLQVPAERDLERRPAVAEHIVGQPEARVEVLPVRRPRDGVVRPPRGPGSADGRPRLEVEVGGGVLRRHRLAGEVQPDAQVEGQAVHGPGVLGIDTAVVVDVQVDGVRRRVERRRHRDAVQQEPLAVRRGVKKVTPLPGALGHLEARLEGMRAGDVRRRGLVGAVRLEPAPPLAPGTEPPAGRQLPQMGQTGRPGAAPEEVLLRVGHAGARIERLRGRILELRPHARLEQQPVADR